MTERKHKLREGYRRHWWKWEQNGTDMHDSIEEKSTAFTHAIAMSKEKKYTDYTET